MNVQTTAARRSLLPYAAWSGAAAVAAILAVYGAATAADVDVEVLPPGAEATMQINAGSVAATTLVALVLGWGLVVFARRQGRPTMRAVEVVAGTVAVVSIALPLAAEGTLAAQLTLAAMHLLTGAVFIAVVQLLRRVDRSGDR